MAIGTGGGGGGAGAAGSNATSGVGGAGGVGNVSSLSGTAVTYGSGGGGGAASGTGGAAGGTGAGAGSASGAGSAASSNTGAGGGGGGPGSAGGAGGSGVIILTYAGAQQITAGNYSYVNGNSVHTVTANTTATYGVPTITWVTAAGNIGNIYTATTYANAAQVVANVSAGTVSYSVTSGALPSGLTLASSTGIISGTTGNVVATSTFTVTANTTASASGVARSFSLTTTPAGVSATYVLVAGGGAGGYSSNGGNRGAGGGAGGLVTGTTLLTLANTYTVVVGAGAAAGSGSNQNNGGNTTFTGLTTAVGGGGGGYQCGAGSVIGANGGSGGGGVSQSGSGSTAAGTGTVGQGYAGAAGSNSSGQPYGQGGGGGAGGAGSLSNNPAGAGGVGLANPISGSTAGQLVGGTYYLAGGGGGGTYAAGGGVGGAGGNGGGGAGGGGSTGALPVNGTASTGGGGGGAEYNSARGSSGGSGIVIISYAGAQQFGGGVVTSVGGNTIHTFTTSSTLVPLNALSVNYLIVAGGGAGGPYDGGGGGAGGMQTGSGLVIDTNSIYVVTVGAGGAGVTSAVLLSGNSGTNSSFSAYVTASVGGGGGGSINGVTNSPGLSGGSGGGGSYGGSTVAGGSGTSVQGNAGGTGGGSGTNSAGGGGGAGAAGQNSVSNSQGGAGGNGLTSSISGTATYYAGGGGGGSDQASSTQALGGLGGGGNSAYSRANNGTAGTANTGGGGGGGVETARTGYSGGSGIVIISYPGSTQQMAGGTVTITGGNVIHTFTSSGYLTPLKLVGNSLRFRSSTSAYLVRTPSVTSNQQTFTISQWVKRGALGNLGTLNQAYYATTGGRYNGVRFNTDDTIFILSNPYSTSSSSTVSGTTTQVFRDPAAWYHFVFAWDTTQATASNRFKMYVNGVQVTSFSSISYPAQNSNLFFNINTSQFRIGDDGTGSYFDGYMTEVNFIDGQALTPNSFGSFNSYGVWQPIGYGGSYGTNGFYLPFTANTATYAGSFNGSNQYLSVAQNAAFSLSTGDFTVETWVYANSWNSVNPIIALGDGAVGGGSPVYSGWVMRYDNSSDGIIWYRNDGGGETSVKSGYQLPTKQWNHIAIVKASNVLKFFANGNLVYSVANTTNYDAVNSNTLKIGGNWTIGGGVVTWVNGYISNTRIVKGTAVYSGNFKPATSNLTAVSGTSLLTLQNASIVDNSTNAFTITNNNSVTTGQTYPFSASYIFNDQGPASNNWTPNNISGTFGSTLDYMTDVPTLTSATAANYCVWNPLSRLYGTPTITDGNLKATGTAGGSIAAATIAIQTTGKWYAETTVLALGSSVSVGVCNQLPSRSKILVYQNNGQKNLSSTISAYGSSYTTNDVIGIAVDCDGQTVTFYKNNVSQGAISFSSASITSADMVFECYTDTSGDSIGLNCGQQPFVYTPPTGFLALNTFNM